MTLMMSLLLLVCAFYNTSMSWYLLFVEALGTQLKLFILGFHGFAQFLENLGEEKSKDDHHTDKVQLCFQQHSRMWGQHMDPIMNPGGVA